MAMMTSVAALEEERRERLKASLRRGIAKLPKRGRWPSMRQMLRELSRNDTIRLHQHLTSEGRDALIGPTMQGWRKNIAEIVKPTPRMRIPEFIEAEREMPMENGLNPGKVKISAQEIARSILLAVHEPGVRTISVCMSPQMCKTFVLECIYAYFAVVDPTSVMIVMPGDTDLKEFVYGKLDKMIELMPALRNRLTKNDLGIKLGPGFMGIQTIAGSDRRLAGKTIRITGADETDKMHVTIAGDPVELLEERGNTFKDTALGYRSCTPTTVKGRIWTYLQASDIRRFFIKCPACQVEQVPVMADKMTRDTEMEECFIRWRKDGTGKPIRGTTRLYCRNPKCKHEFSEPERKAALRAGVSRQTKPFECCGTPQDPMKLAEKLGPEKVWDHGHYDGVGYAMCQNHRLPNGELNPECHSVMDPAVPELPGAAVSNRDVGYHGWHGQSQRIEIDDISVKFVRSKTSADAFKSFMNNTCALPYVSSDVTEIDADQLVGRREAYTWHALNDRGVMITVGVDVQHWYLAVQIVMWGRGRESWLVDYIEIPGNTLTDAPWLRLDALLKRVWFTRSGRPMRVEACCIDTGGGSGRTQKAHRFCLDRIDRFILPINGARENGIDLKPVFPAKATLGTAIYPVGTIAGKSEVLEMLAIGPEPQPGFCHFGADTSSEYLKQLTSERKNIDDETGKISWEKRQKRNEAFDTRVYALAASYAVEALRPGFNLDALADRFGIPRTIPKDEAVATAMSPQSLEATRKAVEAMDAKPRPVVKKSQPTVRQTFPGIIKARPRSRVVPRF